MDKNLTYILGRLKYTPESVVWAHCRDPLCKAQEWLAEGLLGAGHRDGLGHNGGQNRHCSCPRGTPVSRESGSLHTT